MQKNSKFTLVRKQKCPVCGILLNAVSSVSEYTSPSPGDFTICVNCNALLRFGEAMDLMEATKKEVGSIAKPLKVAKEYLAKKEYSIINSPGGTALLCHTCGFASYDPEDVINKYCGSCHKFLKDG